MSRRRTLLRGRTVPLLAFALVLIAGLTVHAAASLPFADKLGDALYAALMVAVLWLVGPRFPWGALAAVALAWCWTVELLQLTSLPAAAARLWPPSRLILGSGFDPLDLLAYAVGVGLTWRRWPPSGGRQVGCDSGEADGRLTRRAAHWSP